MANETLSALGPLFGPNFIVVDVDDETGRTFQLNVYPDANNPLLKANRLPMHFYFLPQRVYLAKKQDYPDDFDFGLTVFKGLMTSETTIGITSANTTDGAAETGGGVCSFSTTFAIPDTVIQAAIQKLKNRDSRTPPGAQWAHFFDHGVADPEPELGIVPILENNVTVEVPALSEVGTDKLPYHINAQGAGKGSIEATSISSFLITCNQLAAGVIDGCIKNGTSPFTVHYNLKQQYYINACDIHVIADVDKVFSQFSSAFSSGGFLGLDSFGLSANYQRCITSGAIKTIMKMNDAVIPDDLKKMIEERSEDMQKRVFDLVKQEIFDWSPQPDAPATAERGLFSSIFGGSAVSMKANYQKRGVHLSLDFRLDSSIAVYDTVSGSLNDLEPAIKADPDRYRAEVDIGDAFQKVQVVATNNANWKEKLPDGTDLADPIKSIQFEVAYPNFTNPLDANSQPNPQFRATGYHYLFGQRDPSGGNDLAAWTADNCSDIINVAFLKLKKPLPTWPVGQVKVRKTIVFNAADPRVELSTNDSIFRKEEITEGHQLVISPSEVGYVFVRFMLDRMLPKENVIFTLTCTLGDRTDTLTITKQNQKNVIWEIFSDKYLSTDAFRYQVQVEVVGPNFTDEAISWTGEPVTVALPQGRNKYLNPLKVAMPSPPTDKLDAINTYIKNYASA